MQLAKHNSYTSRYTANKGPWKVIYFEKYKTRSEAMLREKALKSGQGRSWIKENLQDWMANPKSIEAQN